MLQIVQGMYFRDVPLTDELHRGIVYTNLRAYGDRRSHSLHFGRLLPSTNFHGLGSLTIEAREQLETVTESGQPEVLVATSGDQLLDEIAAVIAFGLNAVCVRDPDMARRVISRDESNPQYRRGPASILRQTFDASVVLSESSIKSVDELFGALTALERKSYVAAMRAIRQIVDATLIVDEDATLAYTLMVAALESLGQSTEPKPSIWAEYDQRKRERIDKATGGLDDESKERIQSAILANEHSGLQRRFVAFVLDHVESSFYRSEAIKAVRPIGASQLPTALRHAYAIRSRNVHMLENLAPEVWMAADRADTAHVDGNTLLCLEGLARLARHVVRRFIERAPKGVDPSFNYRAALPGILHGRLAAEYWIHQAAGFHRESAPSYFNGMLEFMIDGLANKKALLVDMPEVLEKIERVAPALSNRADRLPMAGMVTLWNAYAPEDRCLALKAKVKVLFENDLAEASIISFAVNLMVGRPQPWSLEVLRALAVERMKARLENTGVPIPKRIDAALHLLVADQLLSCGDRNGGLAELANAVETVPGSVDLIRYEEAITRGETLVLDLPQFVLGRQNFVDLTVPEESEQSVADEKDLNSS